MTPGGSRWRISPEAPAEFLSALDIDPILGKVLYSRGLREPDAVTDFLACTHRERAIFGLPGVDRAIARIRTAIRRREPIVVYGDFDVDGVTATALLVGALRSLGANVYPYIPHRVDEGYGLNESALRRLAAQGAKLVITVDCGIRSIREVEVGIAAGLDIVITDHHSIGPELPPAMAVLNPKREDWAAYPERSPAGVGVAYKLAEALLVAEARNGRSGTPVADPSEWLDLVALGTVADLVPLGPGHTENRSFVRRGLDSLNRAERPGIRALMEVAGIKPGGLDAMGIGYGLAPRLNAAGRLESAMLAYNLLMAGDDESAANLAAELQSLNRRRQDLTVEMSALAREIAGLEDGVDVPLIFAAHEDFAQGIVGLVAGRLTERFYRPSVIVQKGDEFSHGSCRSIPEFNIVRALDECEDLLVRHGGHAAAAGFTIRTEDLPALKERLMVLAEEQLSGLDLTPVVDVDAVVTPDMITPELTRSLQAVEPTGEGNPPPTLATFGLRVMDAHTVGHATSPPERHLRLNLTDGRKVYRAIAFRQGAWIWNLPRYVDIAFHPDLSEWNGHERLQLIVRDLRPAKGEP